MISKDTWNNVLTVSQRRKAVQLLYPNLGENAAEEYSQKITTKLSEKHKVILKSIKQPKDSRFYEISVTYRL
jgi:hypothetical protein